MFHISVLGSRIFKRKRLNAFQGLLGELLMGGSVIPQRPLGAESQSPWGLSCSVANSGPPLCNPLNCSTPGFPVLHYFPELAQTHVYGVSDAIQPSHPLLTSSPPSFSLSQHQGPLFASGGQSTGASAPASVLPMNIQG